MPYTKIVCTIGPSSESPEVLTALMQNGMSVARINFAHGSYDEHREKIRQVRHTAAKLGKPVAILQDLAGPKIRVRELAGQGLRLEKDDVLILTTGPGDGRGNRVSISHPSLPGEVYPRDPILLADGLLELEVVSTTETDIVCRVLNGGLLTSNKGINLPTRSLSVPALTEKDVKDLAFGLENDVDFVGISFVRTADDVLEVKRLMGENQKPVIAKIEKHEAVKNIDEILEVADGIMVARGDLGVEIPLEQVPGVQKMLIKKANLVGKPVITATQMLRSMVDSPRPTRAEATDVANAVLDGTDAVMLSEETAMGAYPQSAVLYMARIAGNAEIHLADVRKMPQPLTKEVGESVALAACVLAEHLNAEAIVVSTVSGSTAKRLSRFRPTCPIIALSPKKRTLAELCLYWGCMPYLVPPPEDTDDLIESSARYARETELLSAGDVFIITAGHPVGGSGTTNMLRVYQI
ncbi:MAG: pyruvate kinase [Desulfatibacillaceae bacterium]|nr:pyruvate kinase [Desulfatibacillaceae bacterium]